MLTTTKRLREQVAFKTTPHWFLLHDRLNPRINLKLLSVAVGSSVTMLDQFYLKPLTMDMHVEELLAE